MANKLFGLSKAKYILIKRKITEQTYNFAILLVKSNIQVKN